MTKQDKENLSEWYNSKRHKEYLKWEKNPSLLRKIGASIASIMIITYCLIRRIIKGE